MTSYGGRKAPNVSHYIANLNALPSAHDVASQHDENFNIDAELAQFTNTEFLDFDTGTLLEQPFSDFGGEHEESGKGDDKSDVKAMDFVNDTFPFTDMSSFLPASANSSAPTILPNPFPNGLPSPLSFNPALYPNQKHAVSSPTPSNANTTPTTTTPPEPESPSSRHAAEEDKRRRNTAASARFRVKKKQREQALELTAKELENKSLALEQRVRQLETENEWLRGLVVEKNGGAGREDARVGARGVGVGVGEAERKGGECKKGVGTADVVET